MRAAGFLFARSILGTLHSYYIVSAEMEWIPFLVASETDFALRRRVIECYPKYMNDRVALYTDNRIKIQWLSLVCFNVYLKKIY